MEGGVFCVCEGAGGGDGGGGGGNVFFPLLYSFCLSFFSFFLLFVWWRRSVSFSLSFIRLILFINFFEGGVRRESGVSFFFFFL